MAMSAYAPPSPPARPGRFPSNLGGNSFGESSPDWDWQLSDDHYSYHLLYLPAPHESGRGRLRPQTALSACLRQWKLRYPEGDSGQVQRQLAQALEEAARAIYMGAPSGLRWVDAVSQHDYLYEGEVEVDIPSVHTACHSVPLLSRQLEAHLHWLVVPKVSCDVFRQARLELLPELALPAGPADVFAGKDYLSTVQLQNMAPGETVKLGLGVEQSIKVVRNTHFKETTAGMMGGTAVLRHEVVVEASNQLAGEVRLEVLEALPVAANADEVKVKLESSDPPLENLPEPQLGQRWWLSLPAGQKVSARLAYSVEMSSKLELVGGNRREA
jgi:uncharacterized protein (TIGR02231 family)